MNAPKTPGTSRPDSDSRPLITISIPIYNEAENLERLIDRLQSFTATEPNYTFEFLFTDNASTDDGFARLTEYAQDEPRIRVLRFSRNFGFQKSILTNYQNARGVAAVQIDADLQDPPELISEFLRKWEEGYKVVYGVRRRRQEGALLSFGRRVYYWLVSKLAAEDIPRDAGDFRLIDRVIIDHLADVREQTPYLRGMIASLGYPQTGIVYDRDVRLAGTSKFRLFHLIELGIDGITAQSIRPLRLMTMFGFAVSALVTFAGLYYLGLSAFYYARMPSGFTTLVLLLLFLIGLNAFLLGLLGEYIGRIFNNTRGLPMTIIEHRLEPLEKAAKPTVKTATKRTRKRTDTPSEKDTSS